MLGFRSPFIRKFQVQPASSSTPASTPAHCPYMLSLHAFSFHYLVLIFLWFHTWHLPLQTPTLFPATILHHISHTISPSISFTGIMILRNSSVSYFSSHCFCLKGVRFLVNNPSVLTKCSVVHQEWKKEYTVPWLLTQKFVRVCPCNLS